MTKGLASAAPVLACLDSGKVNFNIGSAFLKVVVTIKKMRTTSKTSISETIITEGARCRGRKDLKCMARRLKPARGELRFPAHCLPRLALPPRELLGAAAAAGLAERLRPAL